MKKSSVTQKKTPFTTDSLNDTYRHGGDMNENESLHDCVSMMQMHRNNYGRFVSDFNHSGFDEDGNDLEE